MEFSYRFKSSASSIFSTREFEDGAALNRSVITLENNNVYTKSLIIDISNDVVEVPVIARRHYEGEIRAKLDLPERVLTKKIILPLYANGYPQDRRTFDSIFIQMNSITYRERLQKYITNKNEVYYGGKGIILDVNMEPLVLCTIAARYKKATIGDEEVNTFEYFRPICHISPKVFGSRSSNLMEKNIIKKLIPFYSNNSIYFPSGDGNILSNADSFICKVVIDNLDNFFIKPIEPTPNTCNNETLNQCLVDNIEDIMTHLSL